MKKQLAARVATWMLTGAILANAIALPGPLAAATQTAPNTNITNSASATYTDANGASYSTTSNVVTTVVQNAPVLNETAGAGNNYSPGQQVTDTFVITNNGNASGTVQVNGSNTVNASGQFSSANTDAVLGGTDAASGTLGGGPAVSGCADSGTAKYAVTIGATTTYCASIGDLNTFLALSANKVAAGASITVSVYYTLATSAAAGSGKTISSTLYSNVTYPAVGGAVQEAALSTGSFTETNNVVADANINQYKSASQCSASCPAGISVGDITYTISGTNGGAQPAKDLQSVKGLMGGAWANINGGTNGGGVLFSDKVPQFNSVPLALSNVSGANAQVTITPNTTYGFATGAKAYFVYSTSSTAANWTVASGGPAVTSGSATTFTIPTGQTIYYVGVVIVNGQCPSGTNGFELCAYTANTTTNGNANVATYPALQYSFTVSQPAGPGSANSGSATNVGDAMWGDNQPTEHILGPGIPAGTNDGSSGTPLNGSGTGINYTSSTVTPGGSNQTSNQALATYGTLTGPYDSTETGTCNNAAGFTDCLGADATGSYDAVATSNNSNDFTAVAFGSSADNIAQTGTTAGTPTTSAVTGASSTLCVKHTLFNDGNKNDTYSIAVGAQPTGYAIPTTTGGTASSGWTFGIYSDAVCSSPLGGSSQGATTTASNVAVNSGASQIYYVKYVIPAGMKYFTRFDSTVTATSNGTGNPSNTTHDDLYSSFVALTKSANVTTTNCPTGAIPSLPATDATGAKVCPGGTIQYTIDYRNLVLGTTPNLPGTIAASFGQCYTQVGAVTIGDDGTGQAGAGALSSYTSGNWATYTNGIPTAPTDKDSNAAARSGANASAFTYWTNNPATGSGSATFTAGATRFSDQVGGTTFQLVPKGSLTLPVSEPTAKDWQGTITFTTTVK